MRRRRRARKGRTTHTRSHDTGNGSDYDDDDDEVYPASFCNCYIGCVCASDGDNSNVDIAASSTPARDDDNDNDVRPCAKRAAECDGSDGDDDGDFGIRLWSTIMSCPFDQANPAYESHVACIMQVLDLVVYCPYLVFDLGFGGSQLIFVEIHLQTNEGRKKLYRVICDEFSNLWYSDVKAAAISAAAAPINEHQVPQRSQIKGPLANDGLRQAADGDDDDDDGDGGGGDDDKSVQPCHAAPPLANDDLSQAYDGDEGNDDDDGGDHDDKYV